MPRQQREEVTLKDRVLEWFGNWGGYIGVALWLKEGPFVENVPDRWKAVGLLASFVLIGGSLVYLGLHVRLDEENGIIGDYRREVWLTLAAMCLVYVGATFHQHLPTAWAVGLPVAAVLVLLTVIIMAFASERKMSGCWKVPLYPVDICAFFLVPSVGAVWALAGEDLPEWCDPVFAAGMIFIGFSAITLSVVRYRTWRRNQ